MNTIYKNFEKIFVPVSYLMTVFSFIFLFDFNYITKLVLFIIFMCLIICIASIITYRQSKMRKYYQNIINDNNRIAIDLKEMLEGWMKNEKYGEVVKYGRFLGRALYLSACYKTRIEIGLLVKEAAENLLDYKLVVNTLLDDIGWTNVLFHKLEEATTVIKNGINISEEHAYYKQACQGYRHLMAIELSKWDNPALASTYLDKAYDMYNRIDEGIEKEITLSGLLHAKAELLFKQGEYQKAKDKAIESKDARDKVNELDRQVRCYSLIGKCELYNPHGKVKVSLDYFRKGLNEAENINRIDEIIKNSYGSAICLIKTGHKNQAKQLIEETKKKYGYIPLYSEDNILRLEYEKLEQEGF